MHNKIEKISKNIKSKFHYNYDVSKLTWFKAGGKADAYCLVNNLTDLEIILNSIENIPYFILGSGSNLLIRDGGFKGLIIKLGKSFNKLLIEKNKLIVGASILDINLAKFAYHNSIKDFEFFSGIPGSIGGAIKMNSGCYGFEIKDLVDSVTVLRSNKKIVLKKEELNFSYRESNLSNNDIVLSTVFNFQYGDKVKIENKLNDIREKRRSTQPLKTKTSGSSFKNPKGHFAGQLIEKSGCKGLKVGDAQVSYLHGNFIINTNKASANQIEELGKLIIEKVYKKFEIMLEWEIQIIGTINK